MQIAFQKKSELLRKRGVYNTVKYGQLFVISKNKTLITEQFRFRLKRYQISVAVLIKLHQFIL